ncbi:MAG: FAD-binding protein [Eubacterium ramulus]
MLDFTRDETGESGCLPEKVRHSQPRILFHEDITGKQITQTLLNEVKTKENIEICEYMTMVDLIEKDNVCGGIIIMDTENNVYPVYAEHVVLACGGLGGLYQNSTNFPHISGDALGIALKHQIQLEHMDYIQIHPTTLYSQKPGRRFLVSESVRGEGALLLDKNGQRFTDELQTARHSQSGNFCSDGKRRFRLCLGGYASSWQRCDFKSLPEYLSAMSGGRI